MEEIAEKQKQNLIDNIRGDFTILLFFSIYGLLFICWIIIWINDARSSYSEFDNFFPSFLTASLVIFFISLLVVMFSRISSLKWWNAILVTFFFLGMPFISWILALIGAQIARLFYVPTVKDVNETWDNTKMNIKPRKKYLPVYEEYLASRNIETPYYFSLWQSTIAAMFGGFLGGGLMLSINYKQLGDKKRFAIGLAASILLQFILILFIYGFLELNEQIKFVNIFPFLLFIPTLTYLLYNEFLLERIEPQVSTQNFKRVSWWSVFCVIFITLIFLLYCLDPVILILQAFGLSLRTIFL